MHAGAASVIDRVQAEKNRKANLEDMRKVDSLRRSLQATASRTKVVGKGR